MLLVLGFLLVLLQLNFNSKKLNATSVKIIAEIANIMMPVVRVLGK
ncbi:hypothetical protein [Algibacter mikhailovii]|uniref:Uncharacterized protein n=1 Tax=Algibacter mikhailovii TaxID=425498 RepID=A0A918QU97_9FLAO|nr:hypothetical protein [Algibacter mikhailovii]GGZ68648.1 hypothetical protein GCM10007028_01950 [Algibacter mikhailovii]